MERTYPGECLSKREVRERVYDYVRRSPRRGYGVMLSGPTPQDELAEVRRSGWDFEQLLVVDKVAYPALWKVPQLAPGARVAHSDVAEAMSVLPAVSWFNGDFCGFSRASLRAVRVAAERLLPGGFIALTWARARGDRRSAIGVARRIGASDLDGIDLLVRATAREVGCVLNLDWYSHYNRRKGMSMGVAVWVS